MASKFANKTPELHTHSGKPSFPSLNIPTYIGMVCLHDYYFINFPTLFSLYDFIAEKAPEKIGSHRAVIVSKIPALTHGQALIRSPYMGNLLLIVIETRFREIWSF